MTQIPDDDFLDDSPDDESPDDEAADALAPDEKGERIAKRLARAGLCSRRDAERWIAEGRVTVNGSRLSTPAVTVSDTDRIIVDGKPLPEAERTRLWRYHKRLGLMTTHNDPQGRPTVFDKLPDDMPRVISVGRLDLNSEGLLLLTNDGELARRMELPSTGWVRRYRVRVHGEVEPDRLTALEKGVTIDGVRYGPIKAVLDRQKGSNAWLTVALQEGKNREIRKVVEHLGWQVTRLIRVAYGPFQLGNLAEGAVEEITGKVFKEQLGLTKPTADKALADKAKAKSEDDAQAKAEPHATRVKPDHAAQAKRLDYVPRAKRADHVDQAKRADHGGQAKRADYVPRAKRAEYVPRDKPVRAGRAESEQGDQAKPEGSAQARPNRSGWAKAEPADRARLKRVARTKTEHADRAKPEGSDRAKPERAGKAKPDHATKAKPDHANRRRPS